MKRVIHLLVCESCRATSPEARSDGQALRRARAEGWSHDPDLCPECLPQALAAVLAAPPVDEQP